MSSREPVRVRDKCLWCFSQWTIIAALWTIVMLFISSLSPNSLPSQPSRYSLHQGNLSFNSTGKITGQVHFHSLTKISVPRSMILRGIDSSLPSLVERTPNEAHLAGKNGVKMTWLQTSAMINDGRQCSFILEIHWRFIVGNWFLPLYIYCNVTWNSLVLHSLLRKKGMVPLIRLET